MGKAIFITGTGTDVGKSALALATLAWARGKGLDAAYYKPVQSGTFPFGDPPSPHGDADWIKALLPFPVTAHVTYKFRSPVSPHLASEREGVIIERERIHRELDALGSAHDLVVMEGAGGSAVPLDREGHSLGMLAAGLSLPCLLACAPGLGTLHHTLATLTYLQFLQAPVIGFAFCQRDAEIPELFADNKRTLEDLTGLPCFGSVPHSPALSRSGPLGAAETARLGASIGAAMDAWWNGAAA